MVAGAVAGQAAKAAAGKTASGATKAAGKAAGDTAQKGGRFGIQTPSQERQNSAGNFLNKSESPDQNENEEQDNSSNEMNYTGNRQNSSRDGFFKQDQKKKGKLDLKKLKKASPLLIGLLLIVAPLLLVFGTGSLLFADIDENTQESMDVQYLAMRKVAQTAVKIMLQNGSLPSTFAETLTENGLEVGYLDANGTFIAGLRPNPENSITLASSTNDNTGTDNSLVIRFKNQIIDADSWDYFAETNAEVYSKFNDATYGRAAGHYDAAAEAFYSTINASRNVFSGYTRKDTTDFKEILNQYYSSKSITEYDVIDSKCVNQKDQGDNITSCNVNPYSDPTSALDRYMEELYKNTLVDCDNNTETELELCDQVQASTILYLVNAALNANETYESMKYFLTLEEVMSKTKAGDSAEAPINEMLNYLTSADENGTSAVQSDTMSSILTKSFSNYSGEDAKDYSIDRIGLSNILDIIGNNDTLKLALNTTGTNIASSASSSYGAQDKSKSMIKLLEEVEEPVKPDGPPSSLLCDLSDDSSSPECTSYYIAKAAYDTAYAEYEKQLKKYEEYLEKSDPSKKPKTVSVEDSLKKMLESEFTTYTNEKGFTETVGAKSGELFSKGASILGSRIATFGEGGTAGTKESIAQYQKETNKLIAWEAEVERSQKSPFDISSQNTFLGNIVHSFSNYFYTSTNLSSFSSIIKNSFSSLLPGTFADNDSSFQTTYGECPESEYSDFACSVYSYPTVTFNLEALENYIDTTANNDSSQTLDGYDDYEEYNNKRSSNVGYPNYEIAEKIWDDRSGISKLTGWIKQFTNFSTNKIKQFFSEEHKVKDYFSTYYSRFNSNELAVITGEAFLNGGGNAEAQAYCAYSRFLDQIGYFSEENTNTAQLTSFFIPGTGKSEYIASLENYAEDFKNLSDTEYLARISGISEDEANIVLGYIIYNSYLASIDHDSALAFGKKEEFNFEASIQSESTTQLAIFNSEAKTIDSSSKRREIAYVA